MAARANAAPEEQQNMPNGFSNKGPAQKNSYESWRSDPVYGPGRGGLESFWWVIIIGVGGPALLGIVIGGVEKVIQIVAAVVFFIAIWWGVTETIKQEKAKTAKRNAAFDYWFYHRDSDTWIPANGPCSNRAWWSLDWNRWLTEDEVGGRIPFTSGFNVRLKVFDGRNRSAQVWRDECEVWTIYSATNKRIVTSIPKDDIHFMKF